MSASIRNILAATFFSFLTIALVCACAKQERSGQGIERDANYDAALVINELMPINRTGLLSADGKTPAWMEVKNVSDAPFELEGCAICVGKDGKGEKHDPRFCELPSLTLQPGECLVVLDCKANGDEQSGDSKMATADMKIPSKDGHISIVSSRNTLLAEMDYTTPNPDEALRRTDQGRTERTYLQSPGHDNTPEGYEAACSLIDQQRQSPLRIWEVEAKTPKGQPWVEVKNVSAEPVNLAEYSLKTKMKKDGWQLPEKTLLPGQVFVVMLSGKAVGAGLGANGVKGATAKAKASAGPGKGKRGKKGGKGGKKGKKKSKQGGKAAKQGGKTTKQAGKTAMQGGKTAKQTGKTAAAVRGTASASPASVSAGSQKADLNIGSSTSIILTHNGKFADGICTATTRCGLSMGRIEDRDGFFYFDHPTHLANNTSKAYRFIAERPTFVNAPGAYDGVNEVKIELNTHGQTVRYTLDGTKPTASSKVYDGPFTIGRTTIVRAFAEGDERSLASTLTTGTYIVGQNHKLPIVCITINRADLYDYNRGLMVAGPGGDSKAAEKHGYEIGTNKRANYWAKNTERQAHIAFYDGKEGFETDCGFKIYGGGSREQDKRSLVVKFQERYGGAPIRYDVFDNGKAEEYNALVLRGGSQDYAGTMARDEFFTSLMAPNSPHLLVMDYRPVVLYLNDEYYGIYYLREKINKNYVARHLGVGKEGIDILNCRFVNEGSNATFQALRKYATSHDLSKPEHYQYVSERIDCEALVDHFIGEFYSSNTDLCNVRYVHSSDPRGDQKWHIIFFDIDESWHSFVHYDFYFSKPTMFVHDVILKALLANPDFRKIFLERTAYHMRHTIHPKHAAEAYAKFIDAIRPEMERNCQRWPELSYKKWERNVESFSKNFETRPRFMMDDLRRSLSITPEEEKQYFDGLGF